MKGAFGDEGALPFSLRLDIKCLLA
jgi:hypothetical protein